MEATEEKGRGQVLKVDTTEIEESRKGGEGVGRIAMNWGEGKVGRWNCVWLCLWGGGGGVSLR